MLAGAQTVNRAYAIRMWAENASENQPALVSFDLDNPQEIREEMSLEGHYFRSGVCVGRNYYLIDSDDHMVPYRLIKLNIDTHELSTVVEYDLFSYEGGLLFYDMTYDATTGNVYALAYIIDAGTVDEDQNLEIPLGFFTFDVTTGKATLIRQIDNLNLLTLSASPEGNIYAISDQGMLWDIQKVSGRPGDVVCETGITPTAVQSAEFNPIDGRLYWTGFYATADYLGNPLPNGFLGRFTIGEEMTTFEKAAKMPHNEELVGLFIDPNPLDRNAPGQVENLTVTPDAGGAQSATLTWLNPAKNVGGEALSSNITIEIYRNDALVATLTDVEPGSTGEYTDAVSANALVTYNIVARNDAGNGDATYAAAVFVGHDRPASVQNLKAARTGEGYDISLSWSAPVAGLNGGWLDTSSFTYDVVRYPDGKRIASATTATSLTDNTITATAGYYYSVTAANADGKGYGTASNVVVSGPALNVPYSCDFSTAEMERLWTVIDADNDGQTFFRATTSANGEWFMKFFPDRELGPEVPADDWLVSSPIHLEAGVPYALHYQVRTLGALFPLNFQVTMGSNATVDAQNRVLASYTDFGHDMTWYYNTELVTVDASGDYCFGFHVTNAVSASFSFIVVEQLVDTELEAVSITGSNSPSVDTPTDYTVTIKNNGATAAKGYTVRLVDENNVTLLSAQPDVVIEPQTSADITVSWSPAAAATIAMRAVVEIEGDANPDNNATEPISITVLDGGEWVDMTLNNRMIGYTPVDLRSAYSMTQTIYHADSIKVSEGGKISAISYPYYIAYAVDPIEVKIYLANVEKESFADGTLIPMEEFTQVFDGSLVLPQGVESTSATFDVPFEYTGGNLCVMVEYVGGRSRKGIFFYAYQDLQKPNRLATYNGDTKFDFTQTANFYTDVASIALFMDKNKGAVDAVFGDSNCGGTVYDITGKTVCSFTGSMPQLAPGIYIVRSGNASRKVVIE